MANIQKELAVKVLKSTNHMRIKTRIKRKHIQFKDEFPSGWSDHAVEARKVFKYYCPICLRYFNHILISNCCNNYICRLCIGQQAHKAFSDQNYTISCNHCYTQNFQLRDAHDFPENDLKFYTDTPLKFRVRPEIDDETPEDLGKLFTVFGGELTMDEQMLSGLLNHRQKVQACNHEEEK